MHEIYVKMEIKLVSLPVVKLAALISQFYMWMEKFETGLDEFWGFGLLLIVGRRLKLKA